MDQYEITSITELNNLHLQIMEVVNQYKKWESIFNNNIKFTIRQKENQQRNIKQNCLNKRSTYGNHPNSTNERGKQFLQIMNLDINEHQSVDTKFKQQLQSQYINKILNQLVNSEILTKQIINNKQKQIYKKQRANYGSNIKQNSMILKHKRSFTSINYGINDMELNNRQISQCSQVRQKQIELELQKMTYANSNLISQLSALESEENNFKNYCTLVQKRQLTKKQQHQRQQELIKQEIQKQQCVTIANLQQQQQIQSQIQLLKKLITAKQNIYNSLQQQNYTLGLKNNQLLAKQIYLEKKKEKLQVNKQPKWRAKLTKKQDELNQTFKQNKERKTQNQKHKEQIVDKTKTKQTESNIKLLKQIRQIKSTIEREFQANIFKQKITKFQQQLDQ